LQKLYSFAFIFYFEAGIWNLVQHTAQPCMEMPQKRARTHSRFSNPISVWSIVFATTFFIAGWVGPKSESPALLAAAGVITCQLWP
jgi:hypothetical protein